MYHDLSKWGGHGPQIMWTICLVIGYSFAVIQIYALHQFMSLRSSLVVQKRYPKIVLAEAIAVLLWLIFAFPFIANAAFGATTFGYSRDQYEHFKWAEIAFGVAPLLHFAWIAEVTRLWLISYDLHYLHSSQNQQWKSIVDASCADGDWYIKNKNKYGSRQYLIPRVCVFCLFVSTIVMISYRICYPRGLFFVAAFCVDGFFCGLDVISVFYLYYQCRDHEKLNDCLYFWYEIKITAPVWAVACAVYQLSLVLGFICYYGKAIYALNFIAGILFVTVCLLASLAPSLLRYWHLSYCLFSVNC